MSDPLRYVLVGVGGWGAHWRTEVLPRLRELGLACAVGAVDIHREALMLAKESLGLDDAQLFTDPETALAQTRPDFVIIVVPPAHHESVVDSAVRHGCHILSEKPIADTMEACARIYNKVRSAGLKMAVTMSHRFDQDKQTIERAVKSGAYGPLNYVVHRFTHNCRAFGSWGAAFRHQIPDPLLVEGAVHHFDCLRALAASNARRVYTVAWNPPWGEYAGDSTALVTIEMENGVRCFYEGAKANASTMNGWENDYIRAECRDGTLELDARALRVLRGGPWEAPASVSVPLAEQPAWKNAWLAELYVRWLGGGPAPENTLDDNIHCAALLFASIESAHTGRPVDVAEFLGRYVDTAS
ncbi:MAG: Gfo/Idh/MocA family oxidoreductase [Candidatus Hydrogenedentes bacterium]|nr:Gfo/Idh/MocA family oxidoreductase [Candidatus Hydrogenedentota bacterium]